MNLKNKTGRCALCGKECKLTFEHIPPKSAFNSQRTEAIFGDDLIKMITDSDRLPWDTSHVHYRQQQSGGGIYSLCEECNNKTGEWYGNEYKKMAYTASSILTKGIESYNNSIQISGVYPLRFIKQVCSMFCSVNGYISKLHDMRDFVLDKNAIGLDRKQYKLCMYFTRGSVIKLNGISAIGHKTEDGYDIVLASEITCPPLGFILYLTSNESMKFGIDIMNMGDVGYDDKCTCDIPFIVYEVNNFLPLDYRSKEEILKVMHETRDIES